MAFPEVNGASKGDGNTGYYKVKFNDSQNGKTKTIEIPIGSTISTTNTSYEVKADGVYLNGEKIDEVPVILPQMAALESFDADNNKRLDIKDSRYWEAMDQRIYEDAERLNRGEEPKYNNTDADKSNDAILLGDRVNEQLSEWNSEYYVYVPNHDDSHAFSHNGLFAASFTKNHEEGIAQKSITIETPEFKEYEARMKAEEAKVQAEIDAANKPWWKFW